MILRRLTSGSRAAVLVAALVLGHATPGWCDTPSAGGQSRDGTTRARVDQLIAESRASFQKGDSAAAAEKLLAAWQLERSFAVAANLGTVELDMGRMRDAAEHLDYALSQMPASTAKEKRDKLTEYFRKARAAVGVLRIEIDPPGAAVSLDGKALAVPVPATVYVELGEHHLVAELSGKARETRLVKVGAGETTEVLWRIAAGSTTPTPSPTPVAPAVPAKATMSATAKSDAAGSPVVESRTPEVVAWLLGAAGAVGAGVYMVALGADTRSKSLDRSGGDAVLGTGVGVLVLGVGVGIGGVLFERNAAAPSNVVWVLPYAGRRSGGLGIVGRF